MADQRDDSRSRPGLEGPEATSESLLGRIKAKDPEAWRRLLGQYSPLVYSWCRRSGMRAEDAADVLQEVFRTVWEGIGRYRHDRPGDTFRGWLSTITRSRIHDFYRRRAGQPEGAGGTDAHVRLMAVAEDEPASSDPTSPFCGLLRRTLDLIQPEFEDRTWQAFLLTATRGLTAVETAERLGMKAGAVRQAKYRVLRRLRQELGDLE